MTKCRVLLVEDDIRLASAVVQYLELHNILCDHCTDGEQGIYLVNKNPYDVLITDITMPKISGLQFCEHMRSCGCTIPIIMVTSRVELSDKVLGFEAGTDDYLVKPFELKELLIRVIALSKRKSHQSNLLQIDELDLIIDFSQHKVTRNQQVVTLPNSAWTLLCSLARAWPNPVSKQDLEFALWGDDIPDANGLKVHIHHLRQRIDSPFARPIVHSVRGVGFVLALHDDE